MRSRILLLTLIAAIAIPAHAALNAAEAAKVRRLNDAYLDAWRNNDRKAILALFRADAVISPPGFNAIEGIRAIEEFWWPAGEKNSITKGEQTVVEIGGSGNVAFARGTFAFEFTHEANGTVEKGSNAGNYLMLFARDSKGRWKITHRMWVDRPGVTPLTGS